MGAKKTTSRKWAKRVKAEKESSKKPAHGTIRESMARKASAYSWRDAKQTAKIAKFMSDKAPCIELTIEGMREDGLPDFWTVIVPEGTSPKKIGKIIDKGTEAVGVFNVSRPCPPICGPPPWWDGN